MTGLRNASSATVVVLASLLWALGARGEDNSASRLVPTETLGNATKTVAADSTARFSAQALSSDTVPLATPSVSVAQALFEILTIHYDSNLDTGSTGVAVATPDPRSRPITVDYTSSAGTATASTDYKITNGTLTIPAGQPRAFIPVTIVDDGIDEDNETFFVTISNPTRATLLGGATSLTGTVTIKDDDTRDIGIWVPNVTYPVVAEGSDTTYYIHLRSEPTGDVTVTPSRASGDADVTVSGPLTFTSTNYRDFQPVTVSAAHDDDEENDTAVISHAVAGADYGANNVTVRDLTVTVTDDDKPPPALVLNVGTIAGDNTVNSIEKAAGFSIGGDTGSEGGASVTVSVGGTELTATSADADPATWSVGVPAGASYITGTSVAVQVNASKAGFTSPSAVGRTLRIDLTAPTAPTYTAPGSLKVGEAITTMSPSGGSGIDKYSATGLPSGLSINSTTGAIGGTPDSADANTSSATVTVSDTAGNTATVAIAFPAVAKGDQTLSGFRYSASSVTFGSAAPSVTAPRGARGSVSYSATPSSVCTVNASTGALTIVGAGSCRITATAAGTDDYNEATATFTVTVTRIVITDPEREETIEDEDMTLTGVELSLRPASINEDRAFTGLVVTGSLNGLPRDSPTTVTISVGSNDDAATAGTDYAVVDARSLTIAAGRTSGTAILVLRILDDLVDEPDEPVSITGTTEAEGLEVIGTTVIIVDDDERGVTVSRSDLTFSEGESATYSVVLDTEPTDAVTLTPKVSGSPDLAFEPARVTFTSADWNTAQTMTVAGLPSILVPATSTSMAGGLTATVRSPAVDLCWIVDGVDPGDLNNFAVAWTPVNGYGALSSASGDLTRLSWQSIRNGSAEVDCEGGIAFRLTSISENQRYAFRMRASHDGVWLVSNGVQAILADESKPLRTVVAAGASGLSGDTPAPELLCRNYDDPATRDDEAGAFLLSIGFTTADAQYLRYEPVAGFDPASDLTLVNATADVLDQPYDTLLGYRVRITPDVWGEPVGISVPADAVAHAETGVGNQASGEFTVETLDADDCGVASEEPVRRAQITAAAIEEDGGRDDRQFQRTGSGPRSPGNLSDRWTGRAVRPHRTLVKRAGRTRGQQHVIRASPDIQRGSGPDRGYRRTGAHRSRLHRDGRAYRGGGAGQGPAHVVALSTAR